MMTTKTQEWARQRNFGKARLRGMSTQLRGMCEELWIISRERLELLAAQRAIDRVIETYKDLNEMSKEIYLKEK